MSCPRFVRSGAHPERHFRELNRQVVSVASVASGAYIQLVARPVPPWAT